MSAPIAAYESFLLSNVSTISTLESSLRSLTWFLPGRFKDGELASEALSALLNITSLYHDTLLAKIARQDPNKRPLIPPSLHTRFTRAWSDKSSRYKWISRTLELLRFTELLLEMGLRRKVSSQWKWRAIILLEVVKAALRFLLLRITHRPLLSPPIPERDFDPAAIPEQPSSLIPIPSPSPSSSTSSLITPDHLQNNRVPLALQSLRPNQLSNPVGSDTSVEDYLLPKALTPSSVKPSRSLVHTLPSPVNYVSEILYIMRPLVYVTLLVSDRKSNRALVVALIMELLSRNLRRTPPPSATLERSEYARRDRDILWYLFRGSIWRDFTRPKIEGLVDMTARVPLLGLLGAFAKDWVPLIDEYYYYTAL